MKGEPEWMLTLRLKAHQRFLRKPSPPGVAAAPEDIDFDNINYIEPTEGQAKEWEMVPGGLWLSRFDEAAGGLARTYRSVNPFQAR